MIGSLEDYQAKEAEMKQLLSSLASTDLVDGAKLSTEDGDMQSASSKIGAIREELKSYRGAHPEQFTS